MKTLVAVLLLVTSLQAQNWKDKAALARVQRVCVDQPQEALRQELEVRLRQRGVTVVPCAEQHDAALYVFSLSGRAPTGSFWFSVQALESGMTTFGNAYVEPKTVYYRSLVFSLTPAGSWRSIYRQQGCRTLDCGIKKLDKTIKKARGGK